MEVYKDCCKNCLLSKDSIVSPTCRKEIIQGCIRKQSYFICHKASQEDKDVVCKTFFDTLGHYSQMIRISERLNMIKFVDQPEAEKLPTYNEMKKQKQ